MAYATGGGGDIFAFLDALKTFATGLGWTVVKEGNASIYGNPAAEHHYLFIEKGLCHLTISASKSDKQTAYTDNSAGFSVPDHQLWAAVNTAIDTSLTTWFNHPGFFNGDDGSKNGAVMTNDLTGPLAAWHFFSNATGDYIHCAIQTTGDRFTHFSFGHIDKGSLSHSGGAYASGTSNTWWRDNPNPDPGWGGTQFNDPGRQQPLFFPLRTGLYIPDALPADFAKVHFDYRVDDSGRPPHGMLTRPLRFASTRDTNTNLSGDSGIADHVAGAFAPTWSGQAPMFGIPVVISKDGSRSRCCMVGMFPDVRYINLEGLLPGQEIQLGTDTWKVFPVLRQAPWSDTHRYFRPTTGQYGMAYKKIT